MKAVSAGVNDIPAIREIAFATWPAAYNEILSPGQLDYMLDLFYSAAALEAQMKKGDRFTLAVIIDTPVGFSSVSQKSPGDNTTFRLHKLYVLPGIQGKGAGKFLLDDAKSKAKQQGAALLELNVNRHNRARTFYEKEHFIITAEEEIDIGNGYFMNDYVMTCTL